MLSRTNFEDHTICTLGSHCSLQVLKGAKDEGFKTLLICEKKRENLYRRFSFIDDLIIVDKFRDILKKTVFQKLPNEKVYMIPHGTLISNFQIDEIENLNVPFFGNKYILRWEADRELKQKMMQQAKLSTPKRIKNKKMIKKLSIVKLHGAAGGKGYFLAWNERSFYEGCNKLIKQKVIKSEDDLYIQEYILGIPVYLQFFYSPIKKNTELIGIDRRYESDIDGIGRVPAHVQQNINLNPSYNVIGNFPLVLRESLLQEVFLMADRFVDVTKKLVYPGIPGPFCLEGVYDSEGNFTVFEFSARIVAGTNLFINGSPYSDLLYEEPMSMGRRIARELKIAIKTNMLSKLVT